MYISESKLSKHKPLAKAFLQRAHYVATSRVTSLEGLQIITWNKHLMSVNEDVKQHIEFMNHEKKLVHCYTPVNLTQMA